MNDRGKALFLSYASQDAEATRTIADALRGSGVEVWFDQLELVGVDAWDRKIRGQIASCAWKLRVIATSNHRPAAFFFPPPSARGRTVAGG